MRILVHGLRERFADRLEVALWEEYHPGDIRSPLRWVVTSVEREGHEWAYGSLAAALRHFEQLRESRFSRAPGRYEKPVAQEQTP